MAREFGNEKIIVFRRQGKQGLHESTRPRSIDLLRHAQETRCGVLLAVPFTLGLYSVDEDGGWHPDFNAFDELDDEARKKRLAIIMVCENGHGEAEYFRWMKFDLNRHRRARALLCERESLERGFSIDIEAEPAPSNYAVMLQARREAFREEVVSRWFADGETSTELFPGGFVDVYPDLDGHLCSDCLLPDFGLAGAASDLDDLKAGMKACPGTLWSVDAERFGGANMTSDDFYYIDSAAKKFQCSVIILFGCPDSGARIPLCQLPRMEAVSTLVLDDGYSLLDASECAEMLARDAYYQRLGDLERGLMESNPLNPPAPPG